MKKLFCIAAFAAALLASASCNRENVPANQTDPGKVIVNLGLNPYRGGATKAFGDAVADTEFERTVNRLDIFFFKTGTDNLLDTYVGVAAADIDQGTLSTNATGALTVEDMEVSNEVLQVYVVANAPTTLAGAVSKRADLVAAISAFTQNAAANGLVMIGEKTLDIPAATAVDDGSGNMVKTFDGANGVVLERIVNKITLAKVTKNFDSPAMQAADVTLLGLYVINAPKEACYGTNVLGKAADGTAGADAAPLTGAYNETTAATKYWNVGAQVFAPEANDYITKAISTGNVVTAAGLTRTDYFYFYPNTAAESVTPATGATPDDYVTKLALKVQVGTKVYWYPIGIPQASPATRNLVYEISNVTLKKAGSNADDDGPNHYIDNNVVDVEITVKDWVSAEITGSHHGGVIDVTQ